MKFTKYIWDLYKNSDSGKKELALFSKNNTKFLSEKFDFEIQYEYLNENNCSEIFYPYNEAYNELNYDKVNNSKEAKELYSEIVINNIVKENNKTYNFFFEYIGAYSTALYHRFPEYFIPFYFTSDNYNSFLEICQNFDIILPNPPSRNDQKQRAWYYFELCEILHRFRRRHNISPSDFPAFLYCFAINSLERIEEEDLPKPSRVYFLGAGAGFNKEKNNPDFEFLDNSIYTDTNTWGAGGLKIKKGDLIIMYCLSPRKFTHSIWRAIDDSFVDPFSYYYYAVKIGFPLKTKQITYRELRDNPILKDNGTIKANMQGLNGRALNEKEYIEYLNLLKTKGQNIKELPMLPIYNREIENIENERDVEEQLIEPLLKDLGFTEKDWVRQLPLRMGRQTKYYPDYAIKANVEKGKEKAKIILEAKYSISSTKLLQETFFQARSYALRLKSMKIILADRDFVWLFNKNKDDFDFNPVLKLHWNDLTHSDKLYELKNNL
jgi:hypothetical protein